MHLFFTRISIFLLFTLSVFHTALAQDSGRIAGKILDTTGTRGVPKIKIYLFQVKDSALYDTATTDTQGNFLFGQLVIPNTYSLTIASQGYRKIQQTISLDNNNYNKTIPNILLQPTVEELEAVVVTSVVPVKMKGDTTEFNAAAYHLKPNATAEDLLKKLPGMDVDQSGAIKSSGETVSRVYVNGKRFFGDDPKMATQNLPSDIIDKVQVFDALSDQSAFSGFDDGNRVKTINIVTKKDKNVGYFGKTFAGAGSRGLYALGTATHRFNNDQQISLIGEANSTNQQMFTFQDIFGTSGGGRPGGSGGSGGPGGGGPGGPQGASNSSGLVKTWAGGLNYRDNWGKKTQVSGSYFLNKRANDVNSLTNTQQLYSQDSTQLTNSSSYVSTSILNQRLNLNIETNFDSSNALIVRPNISFQNTRTNTQSYSKIGWQDMDSISNTNSDLYAKNSGYNGSVDLLFQHKFGKKGRTISIGETISGSNTKGNGKTYTIIDNYQSNQIDSTNQIYNSEAKSTSFSTTLSYTEPIAQYQQLELNLNNTYTKNNSYRNTFDYDQDTRQYTFADSLLTNQYKNTYVSNRATLSYRYNYQQVNFSIGGGVQFGQQEGNNEAKNIHIKQNYTNFYPTANFNYKFSNTRNLRFNYMGRTTQPSITQLQPVEDNSNPLSITSGNPELKQSFAHSFRFLYTSFDRQKSIFMDAFLSATLTQNNIVNSITRLSNGGQYTTPINMNGNYTLNGHYGYTFPIRSPKSNLSFATDISSSKTASMINGASNFTYNHSFAERIKWTTNLTSTFDINLSTQPSYNIARYSLQPSQNANYFSQNMVVEATWYTASGWIASSNFNYTYYKGLSEGYNVSIPLLNASFAKQIFKNKAGEIKLSVYDLLNQNKSITNTRTDNAITQVKSNILTRYVLLTFTYNLRNFGKKTNNNTKRDNDDGPPMGPPPGGMGGPPMGPPSGGAMGGPSASDNI
ncbi:MULTISPECIES: outer membrane beta-barrel protein [Chitinophagaceae]